MIHLITDRAVCHLLNIKIFTLLDQLIDSFFRAFLWEFIAALAGGYYLLRTNNIPSIHKIFVWFLWLTLLVDTSGFYNVAAYYSGYEYFSFIKGTRYVHTYWLFNPYHLIAYAAFQSFFITQINSERIRKILWAITIVFIISAILNLILSGIFFISYSAFTAIGGTVILVLWIGLFFYQILRSNRILNFYKDLGFYIAIGALIWHVSITPLFIYNKFGIMNTSPEFVNFYKILLSIMNAFMYLSFAAGFLIVSQKGRSSQRIKEKTLLKEGNF